ncbi:MAG TPA: hypothetical protein VM076_09180 [Gemmatimonadaceae bacterium]|nr:hypothetical protein [Gemmatimonadaceae bacterium]
MSWLARCVGLVALGVGPRAWAQQSIQIDGPSRVRATGIVRRAVAESHDIMFADSGRRLLLPRGSEVPRTVVVLGGTVWVGATVRGDVVVVGGDLFLRPGAVIEGRAVAVGGAVYGSTLATVRGGTESIRDHTFIVTRHAGEARLEYRYIGGADPSFELPVLEGLRIPSYDRVDGASAAWGPILRPTNRWVVDPTVTYRSHLGKWDPGLNAVFKLGEQYTLGVDARRSTFTNDAWIYSSVFNSFNALARGADTRNYYRADRGELELRRFDEYAHPKLAVERFAGVAVERAWSVGARDTLGSRPWSFAGRKDADGMPRGNPPIERGRISSAFVGAAARYEVGDVRSSGTARIEVPFETPGKERFAQLTFDGTIAFPTFGVQRFRTDVHAVVTVGDSAPPQRWAYLGGSGTLPTMEIPLSFGGDQLLHLDSRYDIPLRRPLLPFLGAPTVSLRHRVGSAGVQRLPRFVQNVGAILTLSFFKLEYTIDPATSDSRFAVGLSFVR